MATGDLGIPASKDPPVKFIGRIYLIEKCKSSASNWSDLINPLKPSKFRPVVTKVPGNSQIMKSMIMELNWSNSKTILDA